MSKTIAFVALAALIGAVARGEEPPEPKNIDFECDLAADGSLLPSKWDNVERLAVIGSKLAREADADSFLSRADLKDDDNIGDPATPRDLLFTAAGIDLKSAESGFRMVTLRIQRDGTEVIHGSARAYKDDQGVVQVSYILGATDQTPEIGTTAATTGDLVLTVAGSEARLSFGGETDITLSVSDAATNPVSLCRIEMMADLSTTESPTVESVTAKSVWP